MIGLASLIHFNPQVKMAIVLLAVTAGAPFIPWLVAQGKGDVGYSAITSFALLIVTLVVLQFAFPPLLRLLNTGASPSIWLVAWPMLLFILAPLVVGAICRARSPLPAAHSQRGAKIVSAVSVAQQNTGVVICCLIFALGKYLVAGEYALLGAIVTIVFVLVFMLELGKRFAEKHAIAAAPAAPLAPSVHAGAVAPPAPAVVHASSVSSSTSA